VYWTRETANEDFVRGTELTQCEEFVHFGGVITQDGSGNRDVDRRICLVFGIVKKSSLQTIRKAKDISKSTKVLLYQTLVQLIVYVTQRLGL